ncbi:MAG: acetyl-CoA carboxylase biotin carboxyl carrier protein [Pyrinomonadaceae bacterium]
MSENLGSAKAEEIEETGGKKSAGGGKGKKKGAKPSLNMKELQKLAELVDEHGFTDFEFENENIRVRLSKNPAPAQIVQAVQPFTNIPSGAPVAAQPAPVSQEATAQPASESEASPAEDLHQITSPIVGTFYSAPGPDKEPYVKEGSSVSPDSVVCIVEAMKLMNEIQAEVSGEVVKVYVENGQPVEYGQPLFGIRK